MKTIILGLLVLTFSTVSMATSTGMSDEKKNCSAVVQGNKNVDKSNPASSTPVAKEASATTH